MIFYFWLAKEVFHAPVEWILENVSSSEITYWSAFFRIQNEKHEEQMKKIGKKPQKRNLTTNLTKTQQKDMDFNMLNTLSGMNFRE